MELARFLVECRSLMMDIPRSKKAATPNRFDRFPYNHAVHPHACANCEIFGSKLVFCRNVGFQSVGLRIKQNLCASLQIGQCD